MQKLKSPNPVGPYSMFRELSSGGWITSGQIPIDPETGKLNNKSVKDEVVQVFDNLAAVCQAAGGSLRDIVNLNIYLTDLGHFHEVNEVMKEKMSKPYPARAAIGVNQLPKDSLVEMDAIMVI